MNNEEMIPVVEAINALENLARHVIVKHRGGLTKTQISILVGLKFFDAMSMTEISEHIAASKEQATRAVAPLVKMGYVKRERSSTQFRIVEISLTDEGTRFLEKDLEAILNEMGENLKPLSDKDKAELIDASRTIINVLKKLPHRL